ncbi:porphobilinogen synthase [Methanobrevibacter curvatus]|uniref:Delta-aminolevulinic acid dehydratase n=1 Tax=Methanobrevibacter curvatus TaxID=49547 RepID=A0A166B017_9EURY|nr:porphobilinogen synthase [Methanobrevibacter curvatus]KZX12691.1 delta-aminolevulinic acid dehydratase [Methanobrevibacter curvatus]
MSFPITRMRRLRKSPEIREIFSQAKLNKEDLICPIFIKKGLKNGEKEKILTMPDEFRYSIDAGVEYLKDLEKKGLRSTIIFGLPLNEEKDSVGSPAFDDDGIVQQTIRRLKKETNLVVISDVCLCQYTSHGHCGIVEDEKVLNDESLKYLSNIALSHARAGADIVAPSDMMDGRVLAIREILDNNGFEDVLIMSYSAKYASNFYYPFRDAACSKMAFGDRKSYQMNISNSSEAIRESELDFIEGADVLMVKPAMTYLDIVKSLKDEFNLPIATYNVSGEYSMLKSAISNGYLTEDAIMETLISIKRAGADLIITHFAKDVLEKI